MADGSAFEPWRGEAHCTRVHMEPMFLEGEGPGPLVACTTLLPSGAESAVGCAACSHGNRGRCIVQVDCASIQWRRIRKRAHWLVGGALPRFFF